jgi:glycosyltransferase involved in cell wall biosynthesis
MPKVVNIIEDARLGGPQVRIAEVAKRLKDSEYETTVIIPKKDNERFKTRLEEYGVKYKELSLHRLTKEQNYLIFFLLLFFYELFVLYRFLKKERFDIVHVSGGSWQYKGAIAGKLAGIPVLWHLNDTYTPALFRGLFGMSSGLATAYAYASKRTKTYYQPYVKADRAEFTIPAPVDTKKFNLINHILPPDPLFSELEGKFVIGTVANPSPVKNLETFLKMAERLQTNSEAALAFVVIGRIHSTQQSYFDSLNNLVTESNISVHWAGPRQDVRSLLSRYDVYVCSSLAESSPISVWEAMSMSKPIVSTDVGDVSLYIKDGENGFVVPVGDAERLAERVAQLLMDEELRRKFGALARQTAQEHLDVERCAEKHLEAYRTVLKIGSRTSK